MANLFGNSRRGGDAEEPPPLAGHVEGLVDGLLHVAARLGQHLAHLARHLAGVFFLVLDEDVAGTKQHLGPLGRGNQPPGGEGLFRCGHGQRHILGVRGGKRAHHVGVVGRVQVQHGFAARGREPLAANQVVISGIGHESLVSSSQVISGQWSVNRGRQSFRHWLALMPAAIESAEQRTPGRTVPASIARRDAAVAGPGLPSGRPNAPSGYRCTQPAVRLKPTGRTIGIKAVQFFRLFEVDSISPCH